MTASQTDFDPKNFLKTLTTRPGVYQMFAENGNVLYVGKAGNLKNRVSQYFQKSQKAAKTERMISQIVAIEVIITASETEALLLESNLIKTLRPRYNVLLRDDKSYPYIFVSAHKDYPRIDFHRGAKREKGHYYGPFPSSGAVRETLHLMQKLFKTRQCRDSFFMNRSRPCLQYQIGRCTAPCVAYIEPEQYQNDLRHAELFLSGKSQQILKELIEEMEVASESLAYEKAAALRDQVSALRKIQEQQSISGESGDVDILALQEQEGLVAISVSYLRAGRLLGNKVHFPKVPANTSMEAVLMSFIPQYYLHSTTHREIPKEIILNMALSERDLLTTVLTEKKGVNVKVSQHVRGERAKWVKLAERNASFALVSHLNTKLSMYQRFEALQKVFNLENVPERLECFDVSHSSGEATVASCVVFNTEGPLREDYRRFNIKNITGGDDYAAMRQALERRYTRIKKGEGKLPDILFVDGGKGQLHSAEQILEELQVTGVLLVGVAKGPHRKSGLEALFLSGKSEPLHLGSDHLALHLITQIRDEAHRFAITAHRQRRDKRRQISSLELIEGIGPKRRRQILQHFGGFQEVKRASVDELVKVSGINREIAERIYAALHDT